MIKWWKSLGNRCNGRKLAPPSGCNRNNSIKISVYCSRLLQTLINGAVGEVLFEPMTFLTRYGVFCCVLYLGYLYCYPPKRKKKKKWKNYNDNDKFFTEMKEISSIFIDKRWIYIYIYIYVYIYIHIYICIYIKRERKRDREREREREREKKSEFLFFRSTALDT